MMKKIVSLALAVVFGAVACFAQQDTMHTLIKSAKVNYIGAYLSPEFQYGQIGGGFTSFAGNSAMLIFNKRFAAGLTGATSTQRNFAPTSTSPLLLRSSYGGLKMEYTAKPNSVVHFTFPLVVGYGVARADSAVYTVLSTSSHGKHGDDWHWGGGSSYRRGGVSNEYFVVQPGLQMEINLFRYAKFYAGANYRLGFPTETITSPLSKTTMNGLSLNAGLKVGLFDFYTQKKRNLRFWKKKKNGE